MGGVLKDCQNDRRQSSIGCYWGDLFSKSPEDLSKMDLVMHKIDTGESRPLRQPPRRLPLAQREEADHAVQEMNKQGLIELLNSPCMGLPYCPRPEERQKFEILHGLQSTQ